MFRPKRQKPIEIQVEPVVELDYDLLEMKLGDKKNDRLWGAVFNLLCHCDYGSGCSVPRSMHYTYFGDLVGTTYYRNKRGYKKFKRKVKPHTAIEEIKKRSGFSYIWDPVIAKFTESFMAGEFDV